MFYNESDTWLIYLMTSLSLDDWDVNYVKERTRGEPFIPPSDSPLADYICMSMRRWDRTAENIFQANTAV